MDVMYGSDILQVTPMIAELFIQTSTMGLAKYNFCHINWLSFYCPCSSRNYSAIEVGNHIRIHLDVSAVQHGLFNSEQILLITNQHFKQQGKYNWL